MNQKVLDHYLKFSMYTDPGLYKKYIENLPYDLKELCKLLNNQIVHPNVVKNGNTESNSDMKYGDMSKMPWFKESNDRVLLTVVSIIAELIRLDPRGLVIERTEENRLILSCRYVSILVASILKLKGIPTRVRSGFAPYFEIGLDGKSVDHWVNEYWDKNEERWVLIDIDGALEDYLTFNPYDIPKENFNFSAKAWLDVREENENPNRYHNADGTEGLVVIAWELFYDFHCLMSNEIPYFYVPKFTYYNIFYKLREEMLKDIDDLARLMLDPDENFEKLLDIWEIKKEFRLVAR